MNSLASPEKARSLAQAMRPQMVMLPFLVYLAVVVTNRPNLMTIFLGLILLLASYGLVTLYNDLSDQTVDRLNQRHDIPLANGQLNRRELGRFMLVLAGIGVLSAGLSGRYILLWFGLYALFGWLYSGPLRLQARSYLALSILGLCYGFMPWLLGVWVSGHDLDMKFWLCALSSWLFVVGIISLKDFKDKKGDAKVGKRTLLVVRGPVFVRRFILCTTILAYLALAVGLLLVVPLLVVVAIVAGVINSYVLWDKRIISVPEIRATRGNLARMLFFATVISCWLVS